MKKIAALAFALAFLAALPLRAADPVSFTVGGLSFKRPAVFTWVPVDPAGMRKANLLASDPADASKKAEVTFFHFGPGVGGGVDANIARWVGQFAPDKPDARPVIEKAEVKGRKLTRVRATGTFASGMPGSPTTPMTGYALFGIIVEDAGGDVFVKMTGPASAVEAAAPALEELVRSALE